MREWAATTSPHLVVVHLIEVYYRRILHAQERPLDVHTRALVAPPPGSARAPPPTPPVI